MKKMESLVSQNQILIAYPLIDSVILSHLPDGPTANFRVSSVKLRDQIVRHGAAPGESHPELILNNFDTMLGHRIGRMLASLFPQTPNLNARRVITLHN